MFDKMLTALIAIVFAPIMVCGVFSPIIFLQLFDSAHNDQSAESSTSSVSSPCHATLLKRGTAKPTFSDRVRDHSATSMLIGNEFPFNPLEPLRQFGEGRLGEEVILVPGKSRDGELETVSKTVLIRNGFSS